MTTDAFRTARTGPAGLGGWLWPVTWLAATLPLFMTAAIIAALIDPLFVLLRYGTILYPFGEAWLQWEIGVGVLLTATAWWWAIRWFDRDPRMLRRAPIALLACTAAVAAIGWVDRDHSVYPVIATVLLGLTAASFLGVRCSKRIRNTFVSHPLPVPDPGWHGALFGGPSDWSHRRWLLPGMLAYAAVRLFFELGTFAGAAFETIPPAPVTGSAQIAEGTAAALIAMTHPGRYIEASRVALALSSISAMLLTGALIGLMRGARWTPWLTLGALLCAMAAPLWMSVRDWCCPFVDGPEFERMWHEWCVVILIAALGGALRRWPGTDQQAAR